MSAEFTAEVIESLADVSAADWDRVAGDDNPFLCHTFLRALEESGCVSPETGWAPRHLILRDSTGQIAGAAPLYLKGHSQGEYVFDHNWAHAYESAGGDYYPKLLMAVPFTPATGPRLLARNPTDKLRLLNGAIQVAEKLGVSSLHINFPTFEEWQVMGDMGLLLRKDQQFIWRNDSYETFEDFLNALSSRKRKNLRKERRDALANDISMEVLTGNDLREDHWDAFYEFYMDTGMRKWGRPYLNRTFFSLINERMPEKIVLVMARRDGRYIAGALNFLGRDALFGRNWGCIEDHPFLHFETCYYQAIDFAIAHGLSRVEAGAQGPHKLSRGYMPQFTYSAHWIGDAGFRKAVKDYLQREGAYVEADQRMLEAHGPFKQVPQTSSREEKD